MVRMDGDRWRHPGEINGPGAVISTAGGRIALLIPCAGLRLMTLEPLGDSTPSSTCNSTGVG